MVNYRREVINPVEAPMVGGPGGSSPDQKMPDSLDEAIERARDHLLRRQSPEGFWVGELEADTTVTAGYIPLMYFLTGAVDPVRQQKAVNFVKSKQSPDGSWSTYHGGPGDLSVTIQTYFDLKLAGVSAEEPFMQRARDFVLASGGVVKANIFAKIWLALFGQFDWCGIPAMPPEIILLPNWFYFNIYEFASWSRATIVALMVVLTRKPVCPVPESAYIHELYLEPPDRRNYTQPRRGRFFSWESFFLLLDSLFKAWERLPFKPGRGMALRKAEKWIAEHQEADGSWGGIMLPWVYSLFALKDLGYALDHPVMERGIRGLEDFIVEDDSTLRMQPAVSPIWDTAWSVLALRDSGLPPDHPALVKAARWLLGQQVLTGGDWQVKNPDTKPGAWAFEFENDLYPDIDDTAVVPRALMRVDLPEAKDKAEAIEKALRWTLSLQSANGGWAAFDRDNHKRILAHIPFADFMTPLDPPSPDVTAHAVELLSCTGSEGTPLQKAIAYLKKVQEGDGAWYGRWGVNYIYGTGLVLASLRAAGEDMEQESIQKAVVWLEAHQNNDGGWGETCGSYDDPDHRGEGPSTASQTAWALMGLLAANKVSSPKVQGGIEYLLRNQRQDGTWEEEAFTGTGFPRAFYLRYHLYPGYFPLIALSQFRTLTRSLI